MPKIVDHQQRKTAVMRSALECFARSGYANVSMADIASFAGMARTALYQYFSDKSEILDFAVDYALEVIGRDYEHLCDDPFLPAAAKIQRLFVSMVTDALSERKIMAVIMNLVLADRRGLSRQRIRIFRRIADLRLTIRKILDSGLRLGQLRRLPPGPMARTLTALLLAILYDVAVLDGRSGADSIASLEILLAGLLPQRAGTRTLEEKESHSWVAS